jgi:hypothetical protein
VTILSIPKGLTLDILLRLAQNKNVPMGHVWERVGDFFRDKAVVKTYVVAISNHVLRGSSGKSYDEQRVVAESVPCDVPDLFEILAVFVFSYIRSPEFTRAHLFNGAAWEWVRCKDVIDGQHVAVRGLAPNGLSIGHDGLDTKFGVAGVHRFL